MRCWFGAWGDAAAGGPRGLLAGPDRPRPLRVLLRQGESPGWWTGALAEQTGLTGVAEDEAVQRLFAGQDPLSGEQRVVPLWRTDSRSKLDAGPLQAALREFAAARGVKVSELTTGERFRHQLERISGTRKRFMAMCTWKHASMSASESTPEWRPLICRFQIPKV